MRFIAYTSCDPFFEECEEGLGCDQVTTSTGMSCPISQP